MVKLIGRVRFFRFRERTFFLTKLRKIPPFVFFLLPSGTKQRPDVIIIIQDIQDIQDFKICIRRDLM